MIYNKVIIRYLGIQPYEIVFKAMRNFTNDRIQSTLDEIWLVEHWPVYTQGYTEREKKLYISVDIPIIQSDRGGKITYHGPGQQIMYVLLNLKRRKLNISSLRNILEMSVINTLLKYKINSNIKTYAPGVYVGQDKICSIALRIRKNCCFHGIALNVNMDLSPFSLIHPCGYTNMKMTQMCHWNKKIFPDIVRPILIKHFLLLLNNT